MTSSTQATAQEAKGRAADVKDTAAEQAAHVGGTVKEQAGDVVNEATTQARNLLEEARGQIREQTSAQRDRITAMLSEFADELEEMAGAGGRDGLATEVVRQVATKARGLSQSMDGTGGGDAMDSLRSFARRRPGSFLLAAGIAGVLAGRATRTAKEVRSGGQQELPSAGYATGATGHGSTYGTDRAATGDAGLGMPDSGYATPGTSAGLGVGTTAGAGADRSVDLTAVEDAEVETVTPGSDNEWAPVAGRSTAERYAGEGGYGDVGQHGSGRPDAFGEGSR